MKILKSKIEYQQEFINAPAEALLNSKTVAAFINRSVSWLNCKAVSGGGIPYTKIGNRRLYLKQDVLNWLAANSQKVNSTSEYEKEKKDD